MARVVEARTKSFEVFFFLQASNVHVNEMDDELMVQARKLAGHSSYFECL